jgi:hypothetical protein
MVDTWMASGRSMYNGMLGDIGWSGATLVRQETVVGQGIEVGQEISQTAGASEGR